MTYSYEEALKSFKKSKSCVNPSEFPCPECSFWDTQNEICKKIVQRVVDNAGSGKPINKVFPEIKDSGERREFDTGAVRDIQLGKGRYDLIPHEAVRRLAVHCEKGALKYGERNCEKGIPTKSLLDSALRHLHKYAEGITDEPHLDAAFWNIAFIMYNEKYFPEGVEVNDKKE